MQGHRWTRTWEPEPWSVARLEPLQPVLDPSRGILGDSLWYQDKSKEVGITTRDHVSQWPQGNSTPKSHRNAGYACEHMHIAWSKLTTTST